MTLCYPAAPGEKGLPVIATRDWHPPDHCSFEAQGGPWPPHCIRGAEGAEFASDLQLPEDAVKVQMNVRAFNREVDLYKEEMDELRSLKQRIMRVVRQRIANMRRIALGRRHTGIVSHVKVRKLFEH